MDDLRIVTANEASWDDVRTVFGQRGDAAQCFCQRYKSWDIWYDVPREDLAARLRDQTACGDRDATDTSGLVAYLGDEPVAWCAVEPRTAYDRLLKMPIPWKGRDEDKHDDTVWAVTCFIVRAGYRRRGISGALARAAVDHARRNGARALEAYPMITTGKDVTWGELHVGARSVFAAAGFTQLTHPTLRRVVMRVDF